MLVVEDHNDTRDLLVRLLERIGHTVIGVGTAREALDFLKVFRFTALVCDIGLPDGTGLEVVKEAKRLQPWDRTIALTAYGAPADVERGHMAGFDHYLTKPMDFGYLRWLLAAASDNTSTLASA